jgi:small-conductance mechanosensitive channel
MEAAKEDKGVGQILLAVTVVLAAALVLLLLQGAPLQQGKATLAGLHLARGLQIMAVVAAAGRVALAALELQALVVMVVLVLQVQYLEHQSHTLAAAVVERMLAAQQALAGRAAAAREALMALLVQMGQPIPAVVVVVLERF